MSEHGHQFATIKTEVKTIPPASVQVNFNIKEGPTVKVGQIKFTGNQHIDSLTLRRSMKNLKPIGIPYSLIFEDIFSQTFDASKLEEDAERVRLAYRDKGYYNVAVEEPKTQIRDEGGLNLFTFRPNKGKRIDILMPIEEGARYRLGSITFSGNKAVKDSKALRSIFAIKDGDWFNATMIQKGLENLKKAYGQGATPTSAPFPSRYTTMRRRRFRWTSILTRASSFTYRGLSLPATRLRATRLYGAS